MSSKFSKRISATKMRLAGFLEGARVAGSWATGYLILYLPQLVSKLQSAVRYGSNRLFPAPKSGVNKDTTTSWRDEVPTDISGVVTSGILSICICLFGFGIWAGTAPLAAAIVTPGIVTASGQNQKIQHLEGGIVAKVAVKEGEEVKAGDLLIKLDPTASFSNWNRIRKQLFTLRLRAIRLRSDCHETKILEFPDEIVEEAISFHLDELIEEQQEEHRESCAVFVQEKNIQKQQIAALEQSLIGLQAQQTGYQQKIEITDEDIGRFEKLLKKGLARRSSLSQLRMQATDLQARLGQVAADILATKTRINEAEQQLARLSTKRDEGNAGLLSETLSGVTDLEEQLRTAEQVFKRTSIKANQAGRIVKITHKAKGAVVRPGQELLEILPTGAKPLIEAQIPTNNIDLVTLGQDAQLGLTALNQRTTPKVDASVIYVSADRLTNEQTGEAYYKVRLEIKGDLPKEIRPDQIYAGMPVETYINTGERTFIEYLLKPITDSFNRAFKES